MPQSGKSEIREEKKYPILFIGYFFSCNKGREKGHRINEPVPGGENGMEGNSLITRARQGDRDAFAELYAQVYQDLYRFALYILKNRHDAEDVVSDTVVAAYEQIRKLRREEAFRGWIFKICSNRCRRKLKEYINKTEELPDDLAASGGDLSEQTQVRTAFAKLSEEERLIISMHIFAGYTSKEIGKILHMNDNTVRSKENRALKKMEKFMAE